MNLIIGWIYIHNYIFNYLNGLKSMQKNTKVSLLSLLSIESYCNCQSSNINNIE